jgi:hypothetical protein
MAGIAQAGFAADAQLASRHSACLPAGRPDALTQCLIQHSFFTTAFQMTRDN